MVEVPHELPILRKLEDAVLRRSSGHPDKTLTIHDNGLQRGGPERMISRTSPRMGYISFLIQFDELRSPNATVEPVVFPADFIRVRFRCPIQEPDMIVLFDENTCHLLHAPSIGQRLRPKRVYFEQRGAILIDSLPLSRLRMPD